MKITFMGAGSTVFVRNVLGDCMLTELGKDCDIALYDIDGERLKDSEIMLQALNQNINGGKARIKGYLGVENRCAALEGADFVINAIQVGGYEPCTVTDFEIPKKFGLRQTIADTLGIGGIMRGLRTIPVLKDFAEDMQAVCPNAWFLNYVNPMAILTGYMLRFTGIKTVGLCHSVQVCAKALMDGVGMEYDESVQWKIAGINHMAWLLEITKDGRDLYPEIKRRSLENGAPDWDRVRHYIMHNFGYYVTESSEHFSEYTPYFIKDKYPSLIEQFNIPLDEYPRRCVNQINEWKQMRDQLTKDPTITHERSKEYGSYIIESICLNKPYKIGGNIINNGLIENLPDEACVEVPCLVDASGICGTKVGRLPTQLAALNMSNIAPQLLTIEAAVTGKKEYIYYAAMSDPHTSSELSIDDTKKLVDALLEAHGDWLPAYH